MRIVWFGCLLLLPCSVQAAVSINEIAWMGSDESANHEWIELYNDGSAVDVTGWSLEDNANLAIDLSGTIPANKYMVLERTSDESAQGSAFLIYTGALVNTGTTLRLKRADGTLEDQVSGGENWESIGGDNVTKETAQYTNTGWVTGPATPGSKNITQASVVEETETTTSSESSQTTTSAKTTKKNNNPGETVRLVVPDVTLKLDVDAQTVGYVNQDIDFSVKSYGIGDVLIDSLVYEWNFGDGNIATTKDVKHIFKFPGTYVVTVYAEFKRQHQAARHEITVLPVAVSLTTNKHGDVQVNNDFPYEIDISGYLVRADQSFRFPPRSIILPQQTVTVPREKLGSTKNKLIAVYDAANDMVTSLVPQTLRQPSSDQALLVADDSPQPRISALSFSSREPETKVEPFMFAQPIPSPELIKTEESTTTAIQIMPATLNPVHQAAAITTATDSSTYSRMTYLALFGLIAMGLFAVYLKPRRNENS